MSGPVPAGSPSSAPEGGLPRRAPRWAAVLAIALGAALAGAGATALATDPPRPPVRTSIGTLPSARTPAAPAPTEAAATPAAAPVRVRIPGIDLDSALGELTVQQDGHLAAPDNPDQVGWWSDGPRPGDPGAAVLVGHVDSRTGPAAFYNLSALRPGERITVERADRTRVEFTVKALRQYAKDEFPDDQVYSLTGPPELHLITCGGSYDHERHAYADNLVVYAALTAAPSPTPTRSGK